MAKTTSYKYKGHRIMKETIREIFDNYWSKIPAFRKVGMISRAEIIQAIEDFHIRNKGIKTNSAGNVNRILKEYAKSYPKRISSAGVKGFWNFNLSNKKIALKKTIKSGRKIKPKKIAFTLTPKKTIGKGQNKVYIFYDKSSKGCKVGKTKNSIEARYAQFKTAIVTPWTLEILLLFKTAPNMDIYEQTLKNILKFKKCQSALVPGGNGTEHFSITPTKMHSYVSQVNSILGIAKGRK